MPPVDSIDTAAQAGAGDQKINIDQIEAQLKTLKFPEDHKYGGVCKCKEYIRGECPVKYIQPAKPQSYKPTQVYMPPTEKFPSETIHNTSYQPIDPETRRHCRPIGGPPKDNLTMCGPFDHNTTHRMSYGPLPCVEPAQRYYPREHDLKGRGPMQDMTTYRHDFTPKPIQPVRPYKYVDTIGLPDNSEPMSGDTTYRLSFTPIDYKCLERPHSYRPHQQWVPPSQPFPRETTYNTSYLPVKPLPRPIPKCKPGWEKPTVPMDTRTTYTESFKPPGQFVRCETPAGDATQGCYCVYPGECLVENFKKAHHF
ncbi:hypothetical protein WDU94_002594 [Cyamophila willieti]